MDERPLACCDPSPGTRRWTRDHSPPSHCWCTSAAPAPTPCEMAAADPVRITGASAKLRPTVSPRQTFLSDAGGMGSSKSGRSDHNSGSVTCVHCHAIRCRGAGRARGRALAARRESCDGLVAKSGKAVDCRSTDPAFESRSVLEGFVKRGQNVSPLNTHRFARTCVRRRGQSWSSLFRSF